MADYEKYETSNIKVFENKVLKEMLEEQLITALDMNRFITVDYTLQATPGMKIEIHTYRGRGAVEDLDMGEGNSENIGATYTSKDYEVITTQGRVPFYDEQQMVDPKAIDKSIQHLAELMTNDITTKVVNELDNADIVKFNFKYDFDDIVDAISSFPEEQINGLFLLIARKDVAKFQKKLKDYLSYTEDFVRTGSIGTIAGVPLYPTDALASGVAYLANKEAVTCFVKKGVETEQERDANTRKTIIYGRNVKLIALTDANKVIKLTADPRFEVSDGVINDYFGDVYEVVSPELTDVPVDEGWFEYDSENDAMVETTDTTEGGAQGKTYYALSGE